jgi:hypothetical protein
MGVSWRLLRLVCGEATPRRALAASDGKSAHRAHHGALTDRRAVLGRNLDPPALIDTMTDQLNEARVRHLIGAYLDDHRRWIEELRDRVDQLEVDLAKERERVDELTAS